MFTIPIYVKQVETTALRIGRSKELNFYKLLKLFVYDRLYMVGYKPRICIIISSVILK